MQSSTKEGHPDLTCSGLRGASHAVLVCVRYGRAQNGTTLEVFETDAYARGPKEHRKTGILPTMVSGIRLALGLRTRIQDPDVFVVFGPLYSILIFQAPADWPFLPATSPLT